MSSFFLLIGLTFFELLIGAGILSIFKIRLKLFAHLSISIITGMALFSIIPFAMQLLYIPLSKANIGWVIVFSSIVLNLRWKYNAQTIKGFINNYKIKFSPYEIPFVLFIGFVMFISLWRSFYLPPTPRDLTSGPEVIAEYAIKEKTMVNSVFHINLETTNNQFKPAYIASLQVIYKYFGFPFGQIWMGVLSVCFIVFLYNCLRDRLHRIISYFLICAFLAIPEMYSYTFIVLFDYSNAVFLLISIYFLFVYFQKPLWNYLAFSSLTMAIATYIRSETLIIAVFFLCFLIFYYLKSKASVSIISKAIMLFIVPAFIFYYISVPFYIHNYLPVKYNINGQINEHLADITVFVKRLTDMSQKFLFGSSSFIFFGTFFYLFFTLLLLDFLIYRKVSNQGKNWLVAIVIIYVALPFLGYLLPLFDLNNTTKRGLFKLFPLLLLYLANNQLLLNFSNKIYKMENEKPVLMDNALVSV